MRYRALSADRDYTFGQGQANFLINNPEAVGQAVLTRLLLLQGQWFLDVTEGLPLFTQIIGKGTYPLYDQAIKNRVLGTEGVVEILTYSSELNPETRKLEVAMTISTIYSQGAAQPVAVALDL